MIPGAHRRRSAAKLERARQALSAAIAETKKVAKEKKKAPTQSVAQHIAMSPTNFQKFSTRGFEEQALGTKKVYHAPFKPLEAANSVHSVFAVHCKWHFSDKQAAFHNSLDFHRNLWLHSRRVILSLRETSRPVLFFIDVQAAIIKGDDESQIEKCQLLSAPEADLKLLEFNNVDSEVESALTEPTQSFILHGRKSLFHRVTFRNGTLLHYDGFKCEDVEGKKDKAGEDPLVSVVLPLTATELEEVVDLALSTEEGMFPANCDTPFAVRKSFSCFPTSSICTSVSAASQATVFQKYQAGVTFAAAKRAAVFLAGQLYAGSDNTAIDESEVAYCFPHGANVRCMFSSPNPAVPIKKLIDASPMTGFEKRVSCDMKLDKWSSVSGEGESLNKDPDEDELPKAVPKENVEICQFVAIDIAKQHVFDEVSKLVGGELICVRANRTAWIYVPSKLLTATTTKLMVKGKLLGTLVKPTTNLSTSPQSSHPPQPQGATSLSGASIGDPPAAVGSK